MSGQDENTYSMATGGIFQCKYDANWTVIYANDSLYHFLGYTKEEFETLFHNQMAGVIYPDDIQPMYETVCEQLKKGNVVINENRLVCKGGTVKWIWISCEYVEDEIQDAYFYCMFHDITRQKEVREIIEMSERRYRIVLSQTQDIIFEWNCLTDEIYYSPTFEKKFGFLPPETDFPQSLLASGGIHPEDIELFSRHFDSIRQGGEQAVCEYRKKKGEGDFLWCRISTTAIRNSEGKLLKAIGMISDIDEQKRKMMTVQEQAKRDPLTGLYNRKETEMLINQCISCSSEFSAFMVVDIDDFKGINDSLGHVFGDVVLGDIAHNMKTLFRSTDIVGRIGGDEFVVFLPGIKSKENAIKKVEELRKIFHSCFKLIVNQHEVTGSIGVTFSPDQGSNYSELFEKADVAMYYAKNNGKNQYALFSDNMEKDRKLWNGHTRGVDAIEIPQKTFWDNLLAYTYRIFYENHDINKAVPILFDLLGKMFSASRVYIFEAVPGSSSLVNTFEWCSYGILPMKEKEQTLTTVEKDCPIPFDNRNVYVCADIRDMNDDRMKQWMISREAVAALLCRVQDKDRTTAIMGFEDCNNSRTNISEEKNLLILIAQTVSLFLQNYRKQELLRMQEGFFSDMLMHLKVEIYGINPETYELIFLNEYSEFRIPKPALGLKCYKVIRGNDEPCQDCLMKKLSTECRTVVQEIYHHTLKKWLEISVWYQRWTDGKEVCIVRCFDITQYKAEASRIGFLMQTIPGGMKGCYLKKGFPLQFINEQMLYYLGYQNEEEFFLANGNLFLNMIHPDDRAMAEKEVWSSVEAGKEYEIICRFQKKDGTYIWVLNKGRVYSQEDGNRSILSLSLDITKRKELEDQLELYRSASQGGAFLVKVDRDFTLLYGNDLFYQILEYTKEELWEKVRNCCREFIYPEDLELVLEVIKITLDKGETTMEWKMRVITGKGNIRWLQVQGTLEYREGELLMNGFEVDITEKHKLMEELAHSEQRYRLALGQTKFHVWECDLKNHCLKLTENSEGHWGYTEVVEDIPESVISVGHIHPESCEAFRELYRRLYAGEKRVEADIKTKTESGEGWQWERIIYTTIFDSKGKPSYAIGMSEDITKQKEAEIRFQQDMKMRSSLEEGSLANYQVNLSRNIVDFMKMAEEPEAEETTFFTYDSYTEEKIKRLVNSDDKERFKTILSLESLKRSFEESHTSISMEYRMRVEKGRIIWVIETVNLLRDSVTGDLCAYGNIQDINEQKMMELAMSQRVQKDSLTGVYNKETAFTMMKEALTQASKEKTDYVLLLFRVEQFNQTISRYGYAATENLMEKIGSILQRKFTCAKIVGRNYEDEFAVFLKGYIAVSDLKSIVNEIKKTLQLPYMFEDDSIIADVSTGIAYGNEGIKSLEELYECARLALDQSLKANQYVVYDERFDSDESEDGSLTALALVLPQDADGRELLLECAFMLESSAKIEKTLVNVLKKVAAYYHADCLSMIEMDIDSQKVHHVYEWAGVGVEKPDYSAGKLETIYDMVIPVMAEEKIIGYLAMKDFDKNRDRQEILNALPKLIGSRLLRKQMERKQEYLGYHDALTGLLNRNSYIKYSSSILEETLISLGVVCVDINGLKKVNTESGHGYGDRLVILTAKAMQNCMQDSQIFRFAGDEFLAVSENLTRETFMAYVEDFKMVINSSYPDGVSVGCVWNNTDIRLESMVIHADERMMITKQEYYMNSTVKAKRKDLEFAENLIKSLEDGYFRVYLQPKADLTTGRVNGAEALIRFIHPSRGMIFPDKFIPALEARSIIHYIDLFVFEEVCKLLECWQEHGVKDFTISLNFSRATLLIENLIDKMKEIQNKYPIPKKQIVIEITESMGGIERESLAQIGKQIQDCGYRLSLDDFGAKYSNLSILSQIQFDELKLDKSLINDLFSNRNTEVIIKNCLNTCRELDIRCVAEGVENAEQYHILKLLKCDYVQGYYYNKPIPIPEFEKKYIEELK